MDGPFELEVHPTYLHFKYPSGFVITAESSADVWAAVGSLCEEHGCTKVLIETTRPERQLDTMSAFESGRVLAGQVAGVSIAICLHNFEFDDLAAFFKTVAQNRGVKVEYFSSVDDALRWLDVDSAKDAAERR